MTTKEEFVQAALDLLEVKTSTTLYYGVGDIVTGAYPGRGDVFGVIAKTVFDDDDYFELLVKWEDGESTRETCDEVITMPEYVKLTGRHYDSEYVRDKVKAAHPGCVLTLSAVMVGAIDT